MHILLTQPWPFLSSMCWMQKQFSLQPFQHRCTSHAFIHEVPLPPQNKAVNELTLAKRACIYHSSPTLWLPPYHEVETGLVSMACWGGRAEHLWKWLMTPLFSVALQPMLVDPGSPGEADTLAVQVVCTICLLCASSRLLLGASLFLGFVTPYQQFWPQHHYFLL